MLKLLAPVLTLIGIWFAYRINRNKRLAERLRSYEAILGDVLHLTAHPWKAKERTAEAMEFDHDDPELRDAVRAYLKAGSFRTLLPPEKFVPKRITSDQEKLEFAMTITRHARNHKDRVLETEREISTYEFSPVHHLDDPDIDERLATILDHVGKNLSSFGPQTRSRWRETTLVGPDEVRQRYRECIEMCPHSF